MLPAEYWCHYRWQAERRKHYPTAANMNLKAEAAAQRQARGELEPETALRQKRLQEVQVHTVEMVHYCAI